MEIIHHYPPELTSLLIDAIPRLMKGKQDVLTFFRGAGVEAALLSELAATVRRDPKSITKFQIVRQVLAQLNQRGDATLRERREILKRVTQWDDFSTCWEADRVVAKGYVAQVQSLVNLKDSVTRITQEQERSRAARIDASRAAAAALQRARQERSEILAELGHLFRETSASRRGNLLEPVLNRAFNADGILIREAFRRVQPGAGVVEQIDGVIEFDGHVYLVEMKWHSDPLGTGEVAQHLVRVYSRADARGLVISASGYTEAAIATARDALVSKTCILCTLEELVRLFEGNSALVDLLRTKVRAAILDKNPFERH